MTELAKDVAAIDVTDLLKRYSFDLDEAMLDRLVDFWLNHYPTQWVRLAVIEALYQGRYKAISVEQILNLWQRRGRVLHHFNHEFERVVCGRFPGTHYIPAPSQYAASARSYRKPLPPPVSQSIEPPLPMTASPVALPEVEPEPIGVAEVVPQTDSTADSTVDPTVDSVAEPIALPEPEPEDAGSAPLSLSKAAPVSAFAPSDRFELEPLVALSAARSTTHRQPIHQFVPSSETSDFYAKLRAVAQASPTEADQG